MYHLRKACQNSLQNYLNEKAYRELEHSIGTEMIFNKQPLCIRR